MTKIMKILTIITSFLFVFNAVFAQNTEKNLETTIKPFYYISFSPNGNLILTVSEDGTYIWDAKTKELKFTLSHMRDNTSFCQSKFSPDNKMVITTGADNLIKLWNVENGELIRSLYGFNRNISTMAFSPDGKIIAAASIYEPIRIWETTTGKLLQTTEDPYYFFDIEIIDNTDTFQLIAGRFGVIEIFDWKSKKQEFKLKSSLIDNEDDKGVVDIALNKMGTKLVAAYANNDKAILWDMKTLKKIRNFNGHTSSLKSISFTTDESKVITSSEDGTLKLWNVETGQIIKTYAHTDLSNFKDGWSMGNKKRAMEACAINSDGIVLGVRRPESYGRHKSVGTLDLSSSVNTTFAKNIYKGTYTYKNGDKYIGEFLDISGKRYLQGKGAYYFVTGSRYEGDFEKTKFEGKGKVFDKNNQLIYEGGFREDEKHGFGIEYLSNGVYTGNFENGKKNGFGEFKWKDGSKYYGEWKEDKQHTSIATGQLYDKNGRLIVAKGRWSEGVCTNCKSAQSENDKISQDGLGFLSLFIVGAVIYNIVSPSYPSDGTYSSNYSSSISSSSNSSNKGEIKMTSWQNGERGTQDFKFSVGNDEGYGYVSDVTSGVSFGLAVYQFSIKIMNKGRSFDCHYTQGRGLWFVGYNENTEPIAFASLESAIEQSVKIAIKLSYGL